MNVMNGKVNQGKGDSLFNNIMNNRTKSKTSKFNNILANKKLDNIQTKTNKKEEISKEKSTFKKSKKEVSKSEDQHKDDDKLEKEESKTINKELENLVMSLIQNTEDTIEFDDIDLNLEELEVLNLVRENLESLLDLEEITNSDIKELFRELKSEENYSEILASENGNTLEQLKELIQKDSNQMVDLNDKDIKTVVKPIVANEEVDVEEKNILNLENDNKENPIENHDGKELEVKVGKRSNQREEISEKTDGSKVEMKNNDGFRTDMNTEIRSKENTTLDQLVNNSPEIEVNEEDVIKQIADKIQFKIGEETSEIKLSLKPKVLGDMIMNLEVTKGEVVAKVFVENYRTKQIIEANLVALQEEIEDTGMEIKTFEVFVGSNTDYEQPNQDQSSFFGKKRQNLFKGKKEDINLISSNYETGTMENNGSSLLLDGQSMDLQA